MQLSSLNRVLAFSFLIVLSVNFISYSVQPYPPSSIRGSTSYSISHCPSHSVRYPVSHAVHHSGKSEDKKDKKGCCPCFFCCIHRSLFAIYRPSVNLSIDRDMTYLPPFDEDVYLEDFSTNLSIRSPPILLGAVS